MLLILLLFSVMFLEPVRKRVNVKDRVGNIQFASKPISTFPHSLAKETSTSSMRPPSLIPAFSTSKFFPVVGPDGIVKLVHSNESAASSAHSSALNFGSSPCTIATSAKASITGDLGISRVSISSSHIQSLNPVAATLALLGIQSPLRQTQACATSPVDQYQQRVANDISVPSTVMLTTMPHSNSESLSCDIAHSDTGTIKETVLFTRSLSSPSASLRSNKTHPN